MSVKIAGIDATQIIENEFRLSILERTFEFILNQNGSIIRQSARELDEIRKNVLKHLQEKHPDSGIKLKESSDE